MEIRILQSISEIESHEWDSFVPTYDPFVRHAFLRALEESKSADESTGWNPFHITLYEEKKLIGVAPVYLKMHSYGEYIFDWGWAEAAQKSGLQYYPKLLNAVPFTPATGSRLLSHTIEGQKMLWSAMNQLCAQVQASSTHILFLPHDEYEQAKQIPQTINRLSYQFHWNNPHVHTFDEWLALFRAKTRKNIKTERKKARDGVDRLFHLWGHELTDRHIEKMWQFYCITIDRKWGKPYLTREFFDHLKGSLADQTLVFFAEKEGEIIASSLCFQRGDHLYGRYWGCSEFSDFLHFELCYHQPIEMCIQKGWTKFEAGAQGQHKLKRGLLPSPTYSVHRLQHPGLQRAVQEAMKRENNHVEREIHIQGQHGPFKRKPTAQK